MNSYYRSDGWVKAVQGAAIAGAQIWVCNQPANVYPPITPPRTTPIPWLGPNPQAQVYSDAGLTPVVQPIQSDGFGHYFFYALPGLYTVVIIYGGKVQQYYVDQSLGGAGSAGTPSVIPAYPGNASLFLDGTGTFSAPPTAATMTSTVGGLVPTPPNDATQFLNGSGVFSVPPAPATMTSTVGGLVPTPPNDATKFLNGTGLFSTPPITIPSNSEISDGMGSNNANATDWRTTTIIVMLPGRTITTAASSWKLRMTAQAGTGAVFTKFYIWKLPLNAIAGSSILSSTAVTIGGSMPKTFSGQTAPWIVDTDAIALQLDCLHDWAVVIYFDNSSANQTLNVNRPTNNQGLSVWGCRWCGGYVSADHSGDATLPVLTSGDYTGTGSAVPYFVTSMYSA